MSIVNGLFGPVWRTFVIVAAVVVIAPGPARAQLLGWCESCTDTSECADACVIKSTCESTSNTPDSTCQVSTCGDFGKCAKPDGGCGKFCEDKKNCGKTCMDSSGFMTTCTACTGTGGMGPGNGTCGPAQHPEPAVGRLFIWNPSAPLDATKAVKCTAVLIAPQYFVVPANCISSKAVATGEGEWATWASTRDGFGADTSAEVDRILSLGSRADHDIALGRLRTPIPKDRVEPVEIRAFRPNTGMDMWVYGHGKVGHPACANDINGHAFDWPNAGGSPTDRGAAAFNNGLRAIAAGANAQGWVHVTRFREEIFGMIRKLEMGFERGVDRFGADMEGEAVTVDSVHACQDVCERKHRCVVFSFVPETGDCFPKAAVPPPSPNEKVISGFPRAIAPFDRPGGDWELETLSAPSSVDCSEKCGRNAQCQAYTFEDGTCTLKFGVPLAGDCWGPECHSGSYRAEVDFDRFGGDFGSPLRFGRSMECAAACAKNAECRAWTFGVPRNGGTGTCWLKNRVADPTRNTAHPTFFPLISGVRRGVDYVTGRPATPLANYRQFEAGAPEPERCQSACENDSRCRAWAIATSPTGRNNVCYLKDFIPAQAHGGQEGVMSGVRGGFKY